MHKTKSYCVVNNFVWEMWSDLVKCWPVPWRNNFAKKGCFWQATVEERIFSSEKNPKCCIHSFVYRNKEFSMVHLVSVMMQKVVTWLSDVLSWKEVKNKQMWVNVLWIYLKGRVQIFRPFWAKKSKFDLRWFQLHLALLVLSLLICDSIFFNCLYNFTKKQLSFSVYSFPPPTLAPFSLHVAQKYLFIYLSYFHSIVINSCSAVQAGAGFYCLGIQAHHEKCCWYWYVGVLCINPPS